MRTSPAASLSPTMSQPDIDECSAKSGGMSWENRIPWLRSNKSHPSFDSNTNPYYGDVMNIYSANNVAATADVPKAESIAAEVPQPAPKSTKRGDGIWNKVSNLSKGGSTKGDEMTVESFSEDEWTPHDSAYGAACPVCGCLPKHIRRGIEVTLIGMLIFLLVYLVVTTSIRINNEHASSSTGSNSRGNLRDDDYFVENSSHSDEVATAVTGDDDGSDDSLQATDDASAVYASDNDPNGGRLLLRGVRLLLVQELI